LEGIRWVSPPAGVAGKSSVGLLIGFSHNVLLSYAPSERGMGREWNFRGIIPHHLLLLLSLVYSDCPVFWLF
jgi:hypothetical protein